MITIHHLGVSQSERIVWLMEELALPYRLKWYDRMRNRLAPPEFLKLHPTAMAPVSSRAASPRTGDCERFLQRGFGYDGRTGG
jgi:hypothetical protein